MFRHRIISAVLLSVFAAQALAQNPDTPQSKPSADTPPAKPAAPSSADAALDDVVVEAVYENPADKPFRTSGSSAYLSEQDVQRFRGTSMGDFLSGIPGVLNGDGRNSGAMDVNIRGMQGQGRVPVIVDGATQETTIYHGYNGAVSRTYLDPDFIGAAEVEKGVSSGADATGASGGVVRISTIGAKDIVLPGRKFGIRLKGGLNTNSRKTPLPGTRGGFTGRRSFDYSYPDYIPASDLFYTSRGIERPSLKATGFNGSIAAAWDGEHIEFLVAYARRNNGNYFAGRHGADKDVVILKNNFGTPYYGSNNPTAYRAGEEVLNTSQDNYSILLKNKFKWNSHSLEFGYNAYRSEYGHVLGSQIGLGGSGAYQNILSILDLDTYTAQYHWQPKNPWIDFKANVFITKADNRVNTAYLPSSISTNPNIHPFPSEMIFSPTWSEYTRKGITLSNRSHLNSTLGMEYGASWVYEDTGKPSGTPKGKMINFTEFTREGWRKEYSLFTNIHWKPLQWLTVDSGLRWQSFSTLDKNTYRKNHNTGEEKNIDPIKDSAQGWSPNVILTWLPNNNWRIYGKYAQTMRNPSIFESLLGISILALPENNPITPERTRNLELGASYLQEGLWNGNDKLRFHAAIFDNQTKNYITRADVAQKRDKPSPFFQPPHDKYEFVLGRVNLDYAKIRGSELTLDYDTGLWFAVLNWNHYFSTMFCRKSSDLSVTLGSERCSAGGIAKGYSVQHIPPRDQLALNIGMRLLNQKLLLGSRYTHIARPAGKGKFIQVGASGVRPSNWKPYNIVDLYGSYQIGKQAEINFAIDNVGDRYYVDALNAAPLPAPGRTIRAGFTAKF